MSRSTPVTARAAWLRAGLIVLAVLNGAAAIVQLFLPKVFYDDFPWPGHSWVAMAPPYNEHLMRDVGASTLAYVLALAVAAVTLNPLLVRTSLAGSLLFAVPHFIFHSTHLDHFAPVDAVGQTSLLAVAWLLPAVMLALTGRALAEPQGGKGRHGSGRERVGAGE